MYLNEDSYLHQINIIETKNNFNFEIFKTREDIKGEFFLYQNKKIFVLDNNNILVYEF